MDIPRGIVSSDLASAVLVDAEGRLDLFDLSAGEIVASSAARATPLVVRDRQVVAYRVEAPDSLVVFAAAPEAGVLQDVWSTALRIPEWAARAFAAQGPGPDEAVLRVEARLDDGDLVLVWAARSFYRGGAPPSIEVQRRAQQHVGGKARIALSDGTLVSETALEPSAEVSAKTPPALSKDRKVVAYRDGSAWATHAWPTADGEAFLTRPAHSRGVALQRRRPGAPDEVYDLLGSADVEASVTEGGRFVFVRPTGGTEDWQIFSAETAEPMGKLPHDEDTVEIASVGENVFALVEQTVGDTKRMELRCRSLRDGHLVWSHALGEERVQSAAPPPPPR